MLRLCAILALCVFASVSIADELRQLVRAGVELQNRIVVGRGGETELRILTQRIEQIVLALPEVDLRQGEYTVACAFLAGLTVRSVSLAHIPDLPPLLAGVSAYLEQRDDEARAALDRVDGDLVDALLAPYLAFVRAELAASQTPDRFLAAAMLSPRSAVEEAALRRSLQLLLAQESTVDLPRLVGRYVARYRQGPFAQKFLQGIESVLVERQTSENPLPVERLQAVARAAGDQSWIRVALDVAQQRLRSGALGDAGNLAREASSLSSPESPEYARAVVYLAASNLSYSRRNFGSVRGKSRGWDLALAQFLEEVSVSDIVSEKAPANWHSDTEVPGKYFDLERQLTRASDLVLRKPQ